MTEYQPNPHDESWATLPAKEASPPTDNSRVAESLRALDALVVMTEMLAEETKAFAAMVRSGDGTNPRHHADRDRIPGATGGASSPTEEAHKAARQTYARGTGPVGGPGTSIR